MIEMVRAARREKLGRILEQKFGFNSIDLIRQMQEILNGDLRDNLIAAGEALSMVTRMQWESEDCDSEDGPAYQALISLINAGLPSERVSISHLLSSKGSSLDLQIVICSGADASLCLRASCKPNKTACKETWGFLILDNDEIHYGTESTHMVLKGNPGAGTTQQCDGDGTYVIEFLNSVGSEQLVPAILTETPRIIQACLNVD